MNFSIKMKLLSSGLASLLIAVVIGATGFLGVSRVDTAMDEIVVNSSGAANHLTADMMHDALRSDVYAALVAAQSGDLSQKSSIIDDLNEHVGIFEDSLAANEGLALSAEVKRALQKARQPLNAFIASSRSMVDLAFTDTNQALINLSEYKSVFDRLAVEMETLSGLFEDSTMQSQQQGDGAVDLSKQVIIGISLAAAIFLIITSLVLSARITGPLDAAVKIAGRIAKGELNNDIRVTSKDETGKLLASLKTMSESLNGIVQSVVNSSNAIASGSQQISTGNLNLSQRTEEQASSLEETASSMEEMTSTVKQNADNADQASQLAQNARDQAESGGQVVSQAVTAMGEINQSSSKIADIISVVEEIAFQTNLLALNAAVEAARAGEQGRGFAVVASEVRVLAGRSADAAKEIKNLIEDSVDKVKVGSELVDKSGETLEGIVTGVKKVTDIVFEIAAASREQSSGIDQVNKAVTQMDEMTQQNASLVEEAASASQAMGEQAAELKSLISFFKLDGTGQRQVAAVPMSPAQQLDSGAGEHYAEARPVALTRPNVRQRAAGSAEDGSWEDF